MSVYGSFCCMGEDEEIPAPIAYQGSHVMPGPGDDRAGSLDLGSIPGWLTKDGWCVHGHGDHDEMDCEDEGDLPAVWPFLRVSVGEVPDQRGETILLDRAQVLALRDELTGWLARTLEGDSR